MPATIDDSTSQFLAAAADDLARQLTGVATVVEVSVAKAPAGVSLVARIGLGDRVVEVTGSGENLVAAYADLRVRGAESTLAVAYRQLVER